MEAVEIVARLRDWEPGELAALCGAGEKEGSAGLVLSLLDISGASGLTHAEVGQVAAFVRGHAGDTDHVAAFVQGTELRVLAGERGALRQDCRALGRLCEGASKRFHLLISHWKLTACSQALLSRWPGF